MYMAKGKKEKAVNTRAYDEKQCSLHPEVLISDHSSSGGHKY